MGTPMKFMSQRKEPPKRMEIKTIAYGDEDKEEEMHSILQAEDQIADFTEFSPKKMPHTPDNLTFGKFALGDEQGLNLKIKPQAVHEDDQGLTGMASAGLRMGPPILKVGGLKAPLAGSNHKGSSLSQRRQNFKAKLGGSSFCSGFRSLQNNDGDSSCSSRFIMKLEANSEMDCQSQKEFEQQFQNQFEQNYKEMKKLGEGCSSVVKKCKHKTSKKKFAVKIIRSSDDEYI